MAQRIKPVARIAPAASGGPGTFRGCTFQTDCAILKALHLIFKHQCAPLGSFSITVEPRITHQGEVTRWDIETSHPVVVSEAKANLSKIDLVEFLRRAGQARGLAAEIELIYGECNTRLLNSANRIRGIAVECGSDHSKFDKLLEGEHIPNSELILEELGTDYRELLPRLSFETLPDKQLKREIESRSRELSPEHHSRLVDFLFRRFFEGAPCRRPFSIDALVESIEKEGIVIARPAEVKLAELAPEVASALALLQATPSGLPGDLVASTLGATIEQLRETLSDTNLLSIDESIWRIRPLPFKIFVPNRAELLYRGFEGLLDFLSSNETDKRAQGQLRNAISLAQQCLGTHPGLALHLFQATEHIVKNLGDKHLLLEISDICIHAGEQSDGADKERRLQARAQAMLCGRSWVFQRTGRLPEARMWAEKSLYLGARIGWDRNTAFAKKCIGRLDRVEAEHHSTSAELRSELLRASAEKLREAIGMFSKNGDFGPTDRQVGDCHSLLARTYLTAGMPYEAKTALREAYDILPSTPTKEYFDLLILDGDCQVKWGAREEADARYTDVVRHHSQGSREHSEIYARALSKRAANRAKLGRKKAALSDYLQSEAVWRSLGEYEEAARMEWARLELEGKSETGTLQLFEVEPSALVRLDAFRAYKGQMESTKALARRSRPTNAHVEQYLKEARKRTTLDYPEW